MAHALDACSVHNRVNALRSSREINTRKTTAQNQRAGASFRREQSTPNTSSREHYEVLLGETLRRIDPLQAASASVGNARAKLLGI